MGCKQIQKTQFQNQQWVFKQKSKNKAILQNINNQISVQWHANTTTSEQHFISNFDRKEFYQDKVLCPYLIEVLSYSYVDQAIYICQICDSPSTMFNAIYTERIYKLYEMHLEIQFTQKKFLAIVKKIIKGLDMFRNRLGHYFAINKQMIGYNKQLIGKVWINSNYCLDFLQISRNFPCKLYWEQQIIKSILQFCQHPLSPFKQFALKLKKIDNLNFINFLAINTIAEMKNKKLEQENISQKDKNIIITTSSKINKIPKRIIQIIQKPKQKQQQIKKNTSVEIQEESIRPNPNDTNNIIFQSLFLSKNLKPTYSSQKIDTTTRLQPLQKIHYKKKQNRLNLSLSVKHKQIKNKVRSLSSSLRLQNTSGKKQKFNNSHKVGIQMIDSFFLYERISQQNIIYEQSIVSQIEELNKFI